MDTTARLGAVAVILLVGPGCFSDSYFREQAIRSAANEHRCNAVKIKSVVTESRMQSEFAYWLDVCGSDRLYRLDTTTGNHFADQTKAVQ